MIRMGSQYQERFLKTQRGVVDMRGTRRRTEAAAVTRSEEIYDLVQTAHNKVRLRGSLHEDGTTMAMPAGFGITSFIASYKLMQIAGVHGAIIEDAAGGSANFDEEITITATDMLYLYVETSLTANPATSTIYLERYTQAASRHVYQDGGDDPDGTKAYLYIPLWLIEFTSPSITHLTKIPLPRSDRAGN
jgi:hypothetical protein